jgi:hypothetical protein
MTVQASALRSHTSPQREQGRLLSPLLALRAGVAFTWSAALSAAFSFGDSILKKQSGGTAPHSIGAKPARDLAT